MVRINNSQILQEVQKSTGLSAAIDKIPNEISTNIAGIIDVQPEPVKVANTIKAASGTTTAAVTVWTTPTDRDFYLTSVSMGFTKDATCDNTSVTLAVIPAGEASSVNLVIMHSQTTTAESRSLIYSLTYPIKLQRNGIISLAGNFSAGTMNKSATICGYTCESRK